MNQSIHSFFTFEFSSIKKVLIRLAFLIILFLWNVALFANPISTDETPLFKAEMIEEFGSSTVASIKVSSTTPAANAKEIAEDASIGITFDGSLNSSTVNSTTIVVRGQTTGTIAGTWSVSGATATFDPTQDLAAGEVIHVEVSTSVMGANGDAAEAFKYSFTTDYAKNEDLSINWKEATGSDGGSWTRIAYGNGRYVAVGGFSANRLKYSTDGISWTTVTTIEQNIWRDVVYGNGKFVAVSSDGENQVMYSADGESWTPVAIAKKFRAVTFGNGRFVAVTGSYPDNTAFYSTDGINWINSNASFFGAWNSVTYGNGRFVAVCDNGIGQVIYSENGETWTAASLESDQKANDWQSIVYGNGRFVALATNGETRAMFSENGETWTLSTFTDKNLWNGVVFGNGLFVAVAGIAPSSNSTNNLAYSEDGENWTFSETPKEDFWMSITYGNGRFVGLAQRGSIIYREKPFLLNAVTPGPNSKEIDATSTIELTFNSNVDAATITTSSVNIRGQQTGTIAGSFSTNGNSATFTPSANFVAGEVIHVDVDTTLKNTDTVQLNLFEAKNYSFTVASKVNATLGSNWRAASASNASEWNSVTYGNGRYVAVTKTGTNRAMYSDDGITWTNVTGSDNSSVWTSVTYGKNRFVAVAENGTNRVMYSDDGKSWTATTASELNQWESVAYGKDRYVAVSKSGTNRVMYSIDGITWISKAATEANLWYSVTYGNGRFVALSTSGTNRVMYSEDGENWTATSATEANSWAAVTYGNGLFVAVAKSGTNRVMYSADGINWTATAATEANLWSSVSYGSGRFMAVALNGTNRVMYSTDAITWTAAASTEQNTWQGITYGGGNFLAVSSEGTNRVMYSYTPFNVTSATPSKNSFGISASTNIELTFSLPLDQTTVNSTNMIVRGQQSGIIAGTWSLNEQVATFNPTENLTEGEVIHVEVSTAVKNAVGRSADEYNYSFTVESPNNDGLAEEWVSTSASENNSWASLAFGEGRFVAVSNNGTNRVMYSDDGLTWTATSASAANTWNSVTYGNGRFVAIASSGTNRAMYSDDGITWTGVSVTAVEWKSITYGNSRFVAVSQTGSKRVMYSENGETWTDVAATEANTWQSVTYGNGLFVAVSRDGTNRMMYSTNGASWIVASGATNTWVSVAYGNGVFVAVGQSLGRRTGYSTDGINWSLVTGLTTNTWQSITFGNGLFVALSSTGTSRVAFSSDGEKWTAKTAAEANFWTSVAYGNGRLVALSNDGTNRVMYSNSPFSVSTVSPLANATQIEVSSNIEITFSSPVDLATLTTSNLVIRGEQSGTVAGTWSVNGAVATFDPTNNLSSGEVIHVEVSNTVKSASGVSASPIAYSFTVKSFDNSELGKNWKSVAAIEQNVWVDVTYGNGRYVAIANSGTNRVMYSDDGLTWVASGTVEANDWISVTYGNGRFVAIASTGTNRVAYSDDGINWNATSATEVGLWNSVTFGNGKFVAVSRGGSSNSVMYSNDGIAWLSASTLPSNDWYSVNYGNGRFVAVRLTGTNRVMYSDDGITWTETASTENSGWTSIAYGNGRFVATAAMGTNLVMYSTDNGETWTATSATGSYNWGAVTFGNGRFVAVASNGTKKVMISEDGQNWTSYESAEEASQWRSVIYGNGRFVGVSANGTNRVMITSAPFNVSSLNPAANSKEITANTSIELTFEGDLATESITSSNIIVRGQQSGNIAGSWSVNGAVATFDPTNDLEAGEVIHVEVSSDVKSSGDDVATPKAYSFTVKPANNTSLGKDWVSATAAEANNWFSVTYGKGRFVAVASNIPNIEINRVMYSDDGVTWLPASSSDASYWSAIAYGNGRFVAVATEGTNRAMYSEDGITWTTASAVTEEAWSSVTYGNGRFVATAKSGGLNRIMYSDDGITWILSSPLTPKNWRSVTYGNGRFVAVGEGTENQIIYSSNGIEWTFATISGSDASLWNSVTYGNGRFVAVAENGTSKVMYSEDGATWTGTSNLVANSWISVTYGNGVFVAVTVYGTNKVMFSNDGETWTSTSDAQSNDWRSVTYGEGKFVAVSANGTNQVMYSEAVSTTVTTTVATNIERTSATLGGNVTNDGSEAITERGVVYAKTQNPTTENTKVQIGTGIGDFSQSVTGLSHSTTYYVRAYAVSNNGTTYGSQVNFTTLEATLTLSSSAPSGNATSVASDANLVLTFSDPLDAASVTSNTIFVYGQQSGVIAGAWSVSGAVATFNPTNDLVAGEVIHVEVRSTVKSSDDGSATPKAYSFTVAPANNLGLAENWTAASATEPNSWSTITYGNGKFVALAQSGTNRVMYSEDGQTWTATSATEANSWTSITYGNGKFVAVSLDGTNRVMYSEDGQTWTASSAAEVNGWQSVTYGNGRFVAVSNTGTNRVMYSFDGATWIAASATQANSWYSVTYGNGKFVAVSQSGTNRVMFSEDGQTWTAANATEENYWATVTYGNGKFVATAQNGANRVMYSEDGQTWTATSAAEANNWYSVTYGNGKFVALTYSGTNRVMYSIDGATWTAASATALNSWYSVTYGNGKFVAVSTNGTNRVMYSESAGLSLVSSTPANNATKVSLSDSLVFKFNENISLVDAGNIAFSGEGTLSVAFARVRGDSLIVGPNGLDYGKDYTITIAEGAVKNESDQVNQVIQVNFRTIGGAPETLTFYPEKNARLESKPSLFFPRVQFNASISRVNSAIVDSAFFQRNEETPIKVAYVMNGERNDRESFSEAMVMLDVTANDLILGSDYTFTIPAGHFVTADGGVNEEVSWSFSLLLNEPIVVSTSPTDNSTKISVTDSVKVTFDQAFTLLDQTKISISATNESPTISSVLIREKTIVIVPTELTNGVNYTVTVGTGSIENADNRINSETTINFRTIQRAPLPMVYYPGKNATQVPLDTSISVKFDKAIQLYSQAQNVKASVTVDGTTYSGLAVSLQDSTASVSFDKANFVEGKQVTVTFGNTESFIANNDDVLIEPFSWSFRSYMPAPTLLSSSPANNATKVSLGASLRFKYDTNISLVDASKIVVHEGDNVLTTTISVSLDSVIIVPSGMESGVTYSVKIDAGAIKDGNDQPNVGEEISFRTIKTTPIASAFYPSNGSVQIPLDSALVVEFDQIITLVKATSGRVIVDGVTYDNLSVSLDANRVVFPSLKDLGSQSVGKQVLVTLKQDAVSNDDDLSNAEIAWSFTTFSPAPTLVSSFPANNASRVSLTEIISFRYDKVITLLDASKIVVNEGDNVLATTVSVSSDSLIIVPSGMQNGITYTVSIGAGAIQDGNNQPNVGEEISFRAIQSKPIITQSYPLNGATGIEFTRPIALKVDQEVSVDAQTSAARITIDGTTYDGLSVVAQGDSLIFPKLSSLGISSRGKDVRVTLYASSVFNEDSLHVAEYSWSFTTLLPQPNTLAVNPANGTNDVASNAPIWVRFDQSLNLVDTTKISISPAVASWSVDMKNDTLWIAHAVFANLTSYTIQVDSGAVVNTDNLSPSKKSWSFVTVVSAPQAPVLVGPSSALINQLVSNTTFRWKAPQNAENYAFQLSDASDFSNLIEDESDLTQTSFTSSQMLAHFTSYFWRVKAGNTAGESAWSVVYSFTTIPEIPTQVFPLLTQTDVSTAPLLQWSTSPAAENLRVQLRFGTDTTMAIVIKDTLTDQSNYQLFGLLANTRYFWSVRVQDDRGTSARSDVRSFLTRQDPIVTEDKDVDVSFNFGSTSGTPTAPGQEASKKAVPQQTDYHMISLPGTDNIRLDAFFATEYKKTWRGFIETGDPTNFYDEYTSTDERFRFTPGLGFWILSTEMVADVRKFTPVQTNTNDAYPVAIHSGWNIIGNPYQSNVDWPLTLAFNAKQSGKAVSGDLWGYEKAFVKTDTLKPLKGYYFYNDPTWNLDTLYLPYTGFGQRGQEGNTAKLVPAETPQITATATYEDGNKLDVNWVFARSEDLNLNVTRRHPKLDFVQQGMIVNDKANKSVGYVRQESELLEDGSSYELELKARRGSTLQWKASIKNLSSDIKVLLINKVTQQSYLVGNEELITLKITEPTSKFDVYIGSEQYLSETKERLMPGEFSLFPNYPNPFNPSTVIRYGLQETGQVKLEVFDILGRKVQTLVNKEQQAGWHLVDFNASKLASGVYLYRLQQGNHVKVQKMTLVK